MKKINPLAHPTRSKLRSNRCLLPHSDQQQIECVAPTNQITLPKTMAGSHRHPPLLLPIHDLQRQLQLPRLQNLKYTSSHPGKIKIQDHLLKKMNQLVEKYGQQETEGRMAIDKEYAFPEIDAVGSLQLILHFGQT